MTRALAVFTVRHRGLRVRVRLLPTVGDVHREFTTGNRWTDASSMVNAYFKPSASSSAYYAGTIAIPANGKLLELVPHEVVHAALYHFGSFLYRGGEDLATYVGVVSAQILRKVRRLGVEV